MNSSFLYHAWGLYHQDCKGYGQIDKKQLLKTSSFSQER